MDASGSELYTSDLLDVTGVPMGALEDLPETAFAAAVRRVIDEVTHPAGSPVAQFTSSLR